MTAKTKLYISGGVLLLLSITAFIVTSIIGYNKPFGIFFYGALLILLIAHQGLNWYILHQFVIRRQRMNNKWHFLNKVALGINFGACFVYLLLVNIFGNSLNEDASSIVPIIGMIIMMGVIFYQENNTNNFFSLEKMFHMKKNKKSMNQTIGFLTMWMLVNLLWIPSALIKGLPLFVFVYIFLLLLQNSLAYTTYGQNKYWNFTYEVVLIIHMSVVSISNGWLVLQIIAFIIGGLFLMRQWIGQAYKGRSIGFGMLLFAVLSAMVLLNPLEISYETKLLSQLIPYPSMVYLIVFALTYIIEQPLFIKRLLKQ